ncbi:MAG TPA: cytochrome c oxidase subunit 3 [Terriglobales bacterium]|nr:cytochrome c oxidase subunit 3 [Terriglobales bacterium]
MRTTAISNQVEEPRVNVGGGGTNLRPPRGGDGGDEPRRQPEGNPRLRKRLMRARVGLGAGATGITIFFLALASAYIVRQGGGKMDPATGEFINDWKPLVLPGILWLNTAILFVSSVTAELARRQMFHEPALLEEWLGLGRPTQRGALPWMGITLILGIGFLIGQYMAWQQLNIEGWLMKTNPSSSFFFILTGAHALHLLGGLIALSWASVATALAKPMESRQLATDISAWYWHFMGLLWLGILGLMYFAK